MTTTIDSPKTSAPPVISLEGVSLTRDDVPVLHDISLTFSEHRIAILGPNGSGKSTLLRLLNGLLAPTTGRVTLGPQLETTKHAKQIRRAVGFVFQNPDNQIVMPSVAEDIAFGLNNLGLPQDELDTRLESVLDRLLIAELRTRQTNRLSGGEKQLLALASVLVMEPSTIVFDEPTTMLDLRNALRIRAEISRLPQRAIIATHDLDLAAETERAIVLDSGRVVFDGTPAAAIDCYRQICVAQ